MAKDLNWNSTDPRKRLAMLNSLRSAMGARGTTDKEFNQGLGTGLKGSWVIGTGAVGSAPVGR